MATFSEEATPLKLFGFLLKMGLLEMKELLRLGTNSFRLEFVFFQKGFAVRKARRKSQTLLPLYNIVEY